MLERLKAGKLLRFYGFEEFDAFFNDCFEIRFIFRKRSGGGHCGGGKCGVEAPVRGIREEIQMRRVTAKGEEERA